MSAPFETSFPAPAWVHHSDLKSFALSPAHYKTRIDQIKEERRDKPAFLFGRTVHAILFGMQRFVAFDGDRRGKAWLEFKEANASRDIITADELERATACANAVRNDPVAGPLVVGLHEQELEWETMGRKCAGRIDVIGESWLVDLKTTTCAEPRTFTRRALGLHYPAQAAWYFDALEAVGRPVQTAHIIAVEVEAPFAPVVLTLGPEALEFGRRENRLWMERLLACEASATWPAYAQSALPFETPEMHEVDFDGLDEEGSAAA